MLVLTVVVVVVSGKRLLLLLLQHTPSIKGCAAVVTYQLVVVGSLVFVLCVGVNVYLPRRISWLFLPLDATFNV